MNKLYTDDNPKTTLKGLGFKNKKIALETIKKVEKYFNNMMNKQLKNIPSYTPDNVLPKKYLNNKDDTIKYYKNQKMYRILGMRNRAKGMLHRVKDNKDFKEAMTIFDEWLNEYKSKSKSKSKSK